MSEHLTRINKLQRVEMIELGLNPLNPDHVNKYLSGGAVRPAVKENEERIKAVMGEKLGQSLGHGNEYEKPITSTDPSHYSAPVQTKHSQVNQQQMRQQLMEDMDDYATSVPNASQGLLNLRQPAPNKINLNEVASVGKKLATNYYNAFIQSLQSPSTSANMQVFKALKAMLEQEQKLKESQALPIYQKAVQSVTAAMYKQLKG